MFSDNCVLIQNIVPAPDGTISVGWGANTSAPGNSGSPEGDFNGCQLQYTYSCCPTPISNYWDGTHLILSWSSATLIGTTNITTGPWIAVPGAVSPYEITPTNPAMFYRLRW